MTTSYINSASAEATSVTIPSHAAGDILLIIAVNENGTTVPTVPSGWFVVASRGSNTLGSVVAYKYAASTSDTSGTWTNASLIAVTIIRTTNVVYIGPVAQNGGNSSSPQYPAITMQSTTWVVGFAAEASNSLSLQTAPTGMTNRVSQAGASVGKVVIHDTNGTISSWTAKTVSLASSDNYHTYVLELWDSGYSKSSGGGASGRMKRYGQRNVVGAA